MDPTDADGVPGSPAEAPVPSSGGGSTLAMALGLPFALGVGVLIGMYALAPTPPPPPPPKCDEKPPEPPPSAVAPVSLVDRAAIGEFKAVDELKARPAKERKPEETIALAKGRSVNKGQALEGFAAEAKKDEKLLQDKKWLLRLREFLTDRDTTNQAAAIVVDLPGTTGPDILYDLSFTKVRTDTTQLAEDLLATKDVRAKASPALLVALDLRNAVECEDFKALLQRAHDDGDRRSLPMLGKLNSKRGCGETKRDDCFECLRPLEKDKEAIDLNDAARAASKRPAPKL